MKRLLAPVCLIACLFIATSCDSSIGDLSAAIRRGWEKLNGKDSPENSSGRVVTDAEREDAAKLEAVPGTPLTDEEKVQVADAKKFGQFVALKTENKVVHEQQIAEFAAKLTQDYPARPATSKEAMENLWVDPFPNKLGDYRLARKLTFAQEEKNIETLFPNASFRPNPSYFISVAEFLPPNSSQRTRRLFVLDRGNLGGWARTAYWYYMRKGFVDPIKAPRFKYLETVERGGRTWVCWSSTKDKTKVWLSMWNDRYEVAVESDTPDMLQEVVDMDFLEND